MRTGSCRRRGGGPAAGARWRPTRAAASTAGLRPERRREAPDGKGPKTSAPRPLRAGRAHRALKAPRRPLRKGRPRRGSRRAVVEAAGSVPSDEAGAREPRGRHRPADPKIHFRRPLLAFFEAGVRPGPAPGVDSARPDSADPCPFFGDAHAGKIPPRSQKPPEGEVTRATPRPSSSPPRRRSSATPPRSRHRSASSRSAAA